MIPTPTTTTAPTAPVAPHDPNRLTPTEIRSAASFLMSRKGPFRGFAADTFHRRHGYFYHGRLQTTTTRTNTACWEPLPYGTTGKWSHQVTLSEEAPKLWHHRTRSHKRLRASAVKNLITHESAHAAFTDPDLKGLCALARKLNVPWSLLNLHEDIRIEALWRQAHSKAAGATADFKFGWFRVYPLPLTSDPAGFLLAMAQMDGDHPTSALDPDDQHWLIGHFMQTADPAQTPDTRSALLRALEFARKFFGSPAPSNPMGEPAPDGVTDGPIIPTPSATAEADMGTPTPTDATATADAGGISPKKTEGGADAPSTVVLRTLGAAALPFARSACKSAADLSTVPRLTQTLADLCKAGERLPVRLGATGSRIHLPAIAGGNPSPFRAIGAAKGRRRICLIMDMSGSMESVYRTAGAAFAAALADLDRKGLLSVDIWLSQQGACLKLPKNIQSSTLQSFGAEGSGEGLKRTIAAAAADIASATCTVIYTDGQLGTDNIAHTTRNSEVLGVCTCADYEAAYFTRLMREHFNRFKLAETPAQLARLVVQHVLSK